MCRTGGQCSQILSMMFDMMAVIVRRSTVYLFLWQTERYEPVLTALSSI